jgi:predicted enzyme related to lactoylglutathione lyase
VEPWLIEFPADEPERALAFWRAVLEVPIERREGAEGQGWQTRGDPPAVGIHERGSGPGDRFALPYFAVEDLPRAIERVEELGGSVVHPGDSFAICRDSEGTPFGLAAARLSGW